jgi:hypothetical protein
MALTPFRWVALAVIGCMLMITALVSIVDESMQTSARRRYRSAVADTAEARLRDRAGGLNQQAQILAARYRLLYLMDSAVRATARVPDTGATRVFIADGYRPEVRSTIERSIRMGRSVRAGTSGRVDLYVVSDTPRAIRGITRYLPFTEVRYQFPERSGDRCRVFIRTFQVGDVPAAFSGEKSSQHILGPCGYYAAFGEPGPAVRQWLIAGGWQYAIEGSWTTAPVIPEIQEDPGIFKGPAPATRLIGVGSATECMKGDLDICERIAAMRVAPRWMGPQVGAGTYAISLGRPRYFRGAIGYQAGELLSDAVREMGRDKFKAFWTSPDSVPVAYEKASGERWGAFLQRWMVTHYGEIHPGPRMSAYAIITSTVLVIIALGATMLMSVRRTYV